MESSSFECNEKIGMFLSTGKKRDDKKERLHISNKNSDIDKKNVSIHDEKIAIRIVEYQVIKLPNSLRQMLQLFFV